ncbi:MAG: B12-binding domain-containing radical SAM protein [Desulfobaccales bacterium]|nr:B12-binding domain-containing radical SAM protein [Desulfobaccales bacterium]
MRTLLLNPEMPASFWSFKQSCELAGRKTLLPPLGLITVAALLPREWEFRLVDLNTRQVNEADWAWAESVMISGMLVQKEGLLALTREAKQRGKTVVVGGPYPTSLPQEALDAGADFLIRGEGENTIPLFLSALKEGKRPGIIERKGKPDLTTSPVPRFDLLNFDHYIDLSLQTSRGCPFDCEFCDVVNLYGRKPRYKNPQQVLAELETLYRLGWRGEVFISDDNFIGNQNHARAILDELIPWMQGHGEPFGFWTQTSVNLGFQPDLVNLLTAANFGHIFIGIESPDEAVLTLNRKYQNLRNPLDQSLANITANGLSVVASFIIGFDQEQPGAGDRICTFVEKNNIPLVMLNTLEVLPNTSLWDRLKKEGRLLETRTSGNTGGGRLNYLPTRPEAQILTEYVDALDRLYEPRRYLSRTYRSFLTMRPTRRHLALQKGEKARPRVKKERSPFRGALRELTGLLKLIWRQGVKADYRWQFWRQLVGIYQKNPSRLRKYLHSCSMGENMFQLREEPLKSRQAKVRP